MMLDHALDYAEAGWAVFPLKGKIPLTVHGHLDATTDPEVIRGWWTARPGANIGAPVPEQLLVLDLDPRNGGRIDHLPDLPETLTAWSGRGDGGRHLYFLRPPGALSGVNLRGSGWDLKLSTGYVVLPPSVHPASRLPYRWENQMPAELPAAVWELLRPPPPRPRPHVAASAGSGRTLVSFVSRFTTQGVNNALYWAAMRALETGVLDEVEHDLVATAVAVGESERQAKKTVESARKRTAEGR